MMKRINPTAKKQKKNREILLVTWIFSLLFLSMAGYIAYYSVTHQQELINNSYNGRQKMLLAQNRRGKIYSADGEVLAHTIVDDEGEEKREYPYGNLFSHAVGYASNGRLGVEAQANYYLINSNAPLSEKASLDIRNEKYPGDDVYTTLDVKMQQVAGSALGVYDGAVLVTEPKTGKILAMVSRPDFDPGQIGEIWEELINDDERSANDGTADDGPTNDGTADDGYVTDVRGAAGECSACTIFFICRKYGAGFPEREHRFNYGCSVGGYG